MNLFSQGKQAAQPRQIRFVSTDGQPQTKRRRVTAACKTCRKRKIRCSGEQPVCKTCSEYGHNCLGYKDPAESQTAASNTRQTTKPDTAPTQNVKIASPPHVLQPGLQSNTRDKTVVRSDPKLATTTRDQSGPQNGHRASAAVDSPQSSRSSLLENKHTHVPYFRYFGPTAIVPGYKQMVVRVRESKQGNPSLSNESLSSTRSPKILDTAASTSLSLAESRSHSIPYYDPDDNLPVSGLISHLCEVFFTHLGCNFPFLQRDRFLRDLREKRVEPILVDAVCAMAARFSLHPLLTVQPQNIEHKISTNNGRKHAHQGQPFAHRAMRAVVDALSFPTLAVVQACLLLAYEEFGSNHDSGLWMYLGISIRMAQDLGMQKLEGMKFRYGRTGLTPKCVISSEGSRYDEAQLEDATEPLLVNADDDGKNTTSVDRAKERERVDSFWALFFLDRVISSGTGRPVTLRDDDIEIFFPLQSESALSNGWPGPFPPLMRIIHLYGRITDLLNAIKEVNHVTPDILKRLAGMESDLTGIYQRLSPKLHFNAANFQDYVKAGEGTNFILLHFWFHALIVLLHQPTLLHSFGGRIQQLFPNSRELSMSSAKTIADILAFAELIDAKSFIGNPFTSQPIYIAACAFLMESIIYSKPSSRPESPPTSSASAGTKISKFTLPPVEASTPSERNSNAKHILLATAAKENYQRCYKALKSLEVYWEGVRYILTVLDQKAKGIGDPLLYTDEEMENVAEPPLPTSGAAPPGWKWTRPNSLEPVTGNPNTPLEPSHEPSHALVCSSGSPKMDPSQAIGWALTGVTDSAQPNLSFLYQMPPPQPNSLPHCSPNFNSQDRDEYQSATSQNTPPTQPAAHYSPITSHYQHNAEHPIPSHHHKNPQHSPEQFSEGTSNGPPSANTSYCLPGNSSFQSPIFRAGTSTGRFHGHISTGHLTRHHSTPSYEYSGPHSSSQPTQNEHRHVSAQNTPLTANTNANLGGNNDIMTIESQDVDMNTLLQDQSAFPFSFDGDFIPWLEYLPADVISYFGEHQGLSSHDGS
ncbi:hypothetical protein ACJ72_01429 [Emergomyces africanus]|uniref:Zn(2)-C6 fungal-type domain-containing protein n=1 Tax=Emergomyces africanus TaxID=1955775 RepID=A0A1B7P5N0_9EURO|nr:hypothetical protein ACJ72_01429 [Emergomyces africanus]